MEFFHTWALHLSKKNKALADDLRATKSQLTDAESRLVTQDPTPDGAVQQLADALKDLDDRDAVMALKDVEILKLKEKLADLVMSNRDWIGDRSRDRTRSPLPRD